MDPWLKKALTNILAVVIVLAICFGIISLCVSCGIKAFASEVSTEELYSVENCNEVQKWQTIRI